MKLVGSAANARVDDGAARAAVLGREVVGDDAKLLDRVRIELNDLIGEALVGCAVGVVIDAIHHEVVQASCAGRSR